jgi:hypothetical protein
MEMTPDEDLFSDEEGLETPLKTRELNQAERLLKLFGGSRKLASLLLFIGKGRHPSAIYRWTYPRSAGGTDGIVPTSAWADILKAARVAGIVIPDELYRPDSFAPKGKFKQDDTFHDKRKKYERRKG